MILYLFEDSPQINTHTDAHELDRPSPPVPHASYRDRAPKKVTIFFFKPKTVRAGTAFLSVVAKRTRVNYSSIFSRDAIFKCRRFLLICIKLFLS